MIRRTVAFGFVILIAAVVTMTAYASEIGHFSAGLPNIRDMVVPAPGFYGMAYNYFYTTDRLNDANGDKIDSITIGGGVLPSVALDLKVDVTAYALATSFVWVTNQKVLGGRYGMYLSPSFTNTSINGALSSASGIGGSISAGQFNIGDIFVQPVWLGWSGKHYDVAYGYGFYIPAGKYKTKTVDLPVVGPVKVEAPDNTGLGFWTNQNQGAVYLYPWTDKRMAIENVLTWEIHRKKRGFDLTPGQILTWNWGVSQYLPLKKDQSLLLEVGPAGYSSFQVSDDTGAAAVNPAVHDRVHAIGLQAGVTSAKRNIVLNFHWLHEFSAVDRFQGRVLGGNLSFKF